MAGKPRLECKPYGPWNITNGDQMKHVIRIFIAITYAANLEVARDIVGKSKKRKAGQWAGQDYWVTAIWHPCDLCISSLLMPMVWMFWMAWLWKYNRPTIYRLQCYIFIRAKVNSRGQISQNQENQVQCIVFLSRRELPWSIFVSQD